MQAFPIKDKESMREPIHFPLKNCRPGGKGEVNIQGAPNYECRNGLVFVTDYPLKRNDILELGESTSAIVTGVVKQVAVCGTKYMVHIDFK